MPIERADGITESERYLKKLCDLNFLSLWSYPGVYNDKGLTQRKQGQEVCDLLVIFDNHVIIFSDKDCQFPNNGNLTVDWNRWFKKSIQESAQQLWGAERWIKNYPNRLFLNNICTQLFPLYIPDLKTAKFHLIAVAHSSSVRCRQEFGGTGLLRIKTFTEDSSHNIKTTSDSPFCIGDIDPNKTFIHVLDDVSLDLVMNTLDTVSDFVAYLTEKEELFRSECNILAASELELLAHYHNFINDDGERKFAIASNLNGQKAELILEEGLWENFQHSFGRRVKLEEDIISYSWDRLIERISYYSMQEKLYFSSDLTIAELETILRFLAKENRFHRRILAKTLCDLVCSAPTDETVTVRYIRPLSSKGICYVFMVFPHPDWMTYEEYREARINALELRFPIAKLRFPNAQHIVGIATESIILGNEGRSEDVSHRDVTEWTSEHERIAKEIQEELKLSKDLKVFQSHHEEFPT
jgi:hypothetical protein